MTTLILNLKDIPLRARACGACSGSSSDNKIRTAPAPAAPEAGAAPDAAA